MSTLEDIIFGSKLNLLNRVSASRPMLKTATTPTSLPNSKIDLPFSSPVPDLTPPPGPIVPLGAPGIPAPNVSAPPRTFEQANNEFNTYLQTQVFPKLTRGQISNEILQQIAQKRNEIFNGISNVPSSIYDMHDLRNRLSNWYRQQQQQKMQQQQQRDADVFNEQNPLYFKQDGSNWSVQQNPNRPISPNSINRFRNNMNNWWGGLTAEEQKNDANYNKFNSMQNSLNQFEDNYNRDAAFRHFDNAYNSTTDPTSRWGYLVPNTGHLFGWNPRFSPYFSEWQNARRGSLPSASPYMPSAPMSMEQEIARMYRSRGINPVTKMPYNSVEQAWANHPRTPTNEELYGYEARKADSIRTGWGAPLDGSGKRVRPTDPRLAAAYDRQQKANQTYHAKVQQDTAYSYDARNSAVQNKEKFEKAQSNYDTLRNNYAENLYRRNIDSWRAKGYTDEQISYFVNKETNKYLERLGVTKPKWNAESVASDTAVDENFKHPTESPDRATSPFIPGSY